MEFSALHRRHVEAQKARLIGFRFLATVVARLAGSKDADFMEQSGERKMMSLDDTEAFFKAWSIESKKKKNDG